MNKFMFVGLLWLVAMASAALLVYKLNPSPDHLSVVNDVLPSSDPRGHGVEEAAVDTEEPKVLEMPMVTIVGRFRGTAEMQGVGAAIIGPGTVTHLE
jgi:hypothetical protein